MITLKAYRLGFAAMMGLALSACAVMPQTFEEKLGTGYQLVTTARDSAGNALDLDKLSSKDGENVLKQTDTAREGLDVAKDLGPELGKDKLDSSIAILRTLDAYVQAALAKRGAQ